MSTLSPRVNALTGIHKKTSPCALACHTRPASSRYTLCSIDAGRRHNSSLGLAPLPPTVTMAQDGDLTPLTRKKGDFSLIFHITCQHGKDVFSRAYRLPAAGFARQNKEAFLL